MADVIAGEEPLVRPNSVFVDGPVVVPLEALPFPLVIAERGGRALAVNTRWSRRSGLDPAASLDLGWLDAFEPRSASRLRTDIERVAAGDGEACGRYAWRREAVEPLTWHLAPFVQPPDVLVSLALVESRRDAALRAVLMALLGVVAGVERLIGSLEPVI